MSNFEEFIGLPFLQVKTKLEEMGFEVEPEEFSKPRESSDSVLVVKISLIENKRVKLWISDFKIDLKGEQ